MVISIVKFMLDYYGICLDAGMEYSHRTLKKEFKFLKRCSFSYADSNSDLVGSGKIIYVKDSYGVIFPYKCPNEIKTCNKKCEFSTKIEEEFEDRSILEELTEMPTYMVHELLSRYKKKPSFYRIIKAELMSRGEYDIKRYKMKREIREIEESDLNDKYQRRRKIKCKKP